MKHRSLGARWDLASGPACSPHPRAGLSGSDAQDSAGVGIDDHGDRAAVAIESVNTVVALLRLDLLHVIEVVPLQLVDDDMAGQRLPVDIMRVLGRLIPRIAPVATAPAFFAVILVAAVVRLLLGPVIVLLRVWPLVVALIRLTTVVIVIIPVIGDIDDAASVVGARCRRSPLRPQARYGDRLRWRPRNCWRWRQAAGRT